MSPSHAAKGGRRYRYYVSQAILQGRKGDAGSIVRVPAMEIARRVAEAVRGAGTSSQCEHSIGGRSVQRVSGHPGTADGGYEDADDLDGGERLWTDLRVWAYRGEIVLVSERASRRPDRLDLKPPGGWLPTYGSL